MHLRPTLSENPRLLLFLIWFFGHFRMPHLWVQGWRRNARHRGTLLGKRQLNGRLKRHRNGNYGHAAKVFPLPSRVRRPFIPVSNRLRTTRTPNTTVSAAFKRAAFPGIPRRAFDLFLVHFNFAPARIAKPLNVVCAALRPSRKSLSLKVAKTSVG